MILLDDLALMEKDLTPGDRQKITGNLSLVQKILSPEEHSYLFLPDYEKGVLAFNKGFFETAEYYFSETVDAHDIQAKEAQSYLALIYKIRNETENADEVLQKALEGHDDPLLINQHLSAIYQNVGIYHLFSSNIKRAKAYFSLAVSTSNNKNSEAYRWLGIIYRQEGDFDRAKKLFVKSLLLDKENPRIHADIAVLHAIKGEHDNALYFAKQARKKDPGFSSPAIDSILKLYSRPNS